MGGGASKQPSSPPQSPAKQPQQPSFANGAPVKKADSGIYNCTTKEEKLHCMHHQQQVF
jgi:hypothetical protein